MITETRRSQGGEVRRQAPPPQRSPITLTGRGGIAVIAGATLLGAVIGFSVLPGLLFTAGCVVAAVATKRSDLLGVAACPPVVFFVVTVVTEWLFALGGKAVLQSTLTGIGLTLTGNAPWLFLGTALTVGLAIRRGLLRSWRELTTRSADLRLTQDRSAEEDPVRWDERD